MTSSWGSSWGTSWAFSWGGGSTPTIVSRTIIAGGWIDLPTGKRRTKKQVQEEREQWGILPKKAKNLIIRVAAQQIEEPDNTDALIAAFDRAELAYKAQYAELYRREIERRLALMREEEDFLMLH